VCRQSVGVLCGALVFLCVGKVTNALFPRIMGLSQAGVSVLTNNTANFYDK
jgi:hypothetical protein